MERTNCVQLTIVLVLLGSLVLVGMPVVEFLFITIASIAIGAGLLYAFLGFAHGIDRVIDYCHEP